jgi:hypothetical protein
MKIVKSINTWMIFLSLLLLAPMSFAETEYVLSDGSRAVIIERHLVLIRWDGKRSVARPGSYETRDGRYTIVEGDRGAVIKDGPKKGR